MSELQTGVLTFVGLIGLSCGCFLYMLGGRSDKWLRRFVASLIITATSVILSTFMGKFSWWLVTIYPILMTGMSLGYGADETWLKVIKRSLFGLAVVSAGLIYCLCFGGNMWWILLIHIGIAVWSVFLGVKSTIHAASEETFICFLLNAGLIMYPFVR